MCGIVGYVSRRQGGLFRKDVDLIEQMLVFNTVRGKDSTGVFCRKANGDIVGTKTATHPFHLFLTKQWEDFGKDAVQSGKFIIGHGRAATRGEVKNDNAHPFIENNIVLVHNGTLRQTSNLTDVSTEVDSHAIAHALTTKTPQEMLRELNGAFALVWFNTEEGKLYAVRNDERPLMILEEGDEGYIICSESWIGGIAAARQSRKITNIITLEPGELYSWDATKRNAMSSEKVSLRQPFAYQGPYSSYSGGRTSSTTSTHSKATKDAVEAEDNPVNFPKGRDATPEEITRLRSALAEQAKSKTTPSQSCALTSSSATGTNARSTSTTTGTVTPSTETGIPSEEERQIERTRSIQVFREDFKPGTVCLFKIISINPEPSSGGRFKYIGKIREPGKEMIDCIGFLPRQTSVLELHKYIGHFFVGLCFNCTHSNNGGTSVLMNSDIWPANLEKVHEEEVPQSVLFRLLDSGECSCCGRKVRLWEKSCTSVRMKGQVGSRTPSGQPLNVAEMLCPDCVISRLAAGSEYRKDFEERYAQLKHNYETYQAEKAADAGGDSSVSDGESERESTSRTAGHLASVPSSKTLH